MHNDFTVFLREYPNGSKVVFYYAYDGDGVRVGPWSTGCKTKTAGRNYCNRLLKAEALIPGKGKILTFGDFAAGFWERGSAYFENQDGRADITDSYINGGRKVLNNQILPFFEKVPLEKITDTMVNDWVLGFKKRDGKVYQNTYANNALKSLQVMMGQAVKEKLIKVNPCKAVRLLKNDRKPIQILTVDEVHTLFSADWKRVWDGDGIAYAANRLASLTGMRVGEIVGLKGIYVFNDYIHVCGQFGDFGYGPTKTKETRSIPLIPEMIAILKKLSEMNPKGYVFSEDAGVTPYSRKIVYNELHRALGRIGIVLAEVKRRGISVHAWRHFLNTELLKQGLTIEQVQSVTGHKSDRMTEWYSHLDPRDLTDVMKAQQLISGSKPELVKQEDYKAGGNVIAMPGVELNLVEQQA